MLAYEYHDEHVYNHVLKPALDEYFRKNNFKNNFKIDQDTINLFMD